MDVRKLEAFCKVYELQSFSKAGEMMYLSQPTISSHVANLEEELGVKLFDRMGRRVIPTQAGEVLYRSAVTIFENLGQAKASIEVLRDKVVGELVIGCSTIPAHNIVPDMVAKFSHKYPDVCFTIRSSDSAQVIAKVAQGDWPVGIVGQAPEEEGLVTKELLDDEIVVVAAADAPWLPTHGALLSTTELVALPWIMRERGSATRRALEKRLNEVGHKLQELNVRCHVDGTCATLAHTLSGVGISVTSLLACQEYLEKGTMVRLNAPVLEGRRRFYLIRHSGRYMFPALKAFIDFVS